MWFSPLTRTQVLHQSMQRHRWASLAGELQGRYQIGPRLRVNEVVCGTWPPAQYLRRFFPPRRFMGSDSVWLGNDHQGFVDIYEAGLKGIVGLSPENLAPRWVLSDIIIILTFTLERPEGFRQACQIPREGDCRKPAWPFSRICTLHHYPSGIVGAKG
jgi:hypothetical protein